MTSEQFRVGQRVVFRPGSGQWFEGKVTRVDDSSSFRVQQYEPYCESLGGDEMPLNRPGETFSVASDSQHIRVLPEETNLLEQWMEADMRPPTFKDPFAHLYMTHDGIASQEETVEVAGRSISSVRIRIPADELQGIIDPDDVVFMMGEVRNRRQVGSNINAVQDSDFRKILASVLPQDVDLGTLRQRANHDVSAMLQLADVTRFGLLGVQKDDEKAGILYMCAAWGVSEEDYREQAPYDVRFAYPMGTPEAMCAGAMHLWNCLSSVLGTNHPDSVIGFIHQGRDSGAMSLLHVVVSLLGHAFRRGWTCPLALAIGQSMRDFQLLDDFIPEAMHLVQALELQNARETELHVHPRMQEQLGLPPSFTPTSEMLAEFSQPSEEQLEMFRPKATEIFLGLRATSMNPSGLCRSDLHVEYREMPFPPYPIVVSSFNPQSRYLYDPVILPEAMAYTPYSEEAFDIIWGRLVFNMHMGDKKGNHRFRPALITFADRPGDRKFAAFVRDRIGANCGTEIRVVNTHHYRVEGFNGGRSASLFEIHKKNEESMVNLMRPMMNWNESEIRTPLEQANTAFENRIDTPVEELLPTLVHLKEEGNGYFIRDRMNPARRCYTEAIDMIRSATNVDEQIHRLLGTLLSNRAACYLKMAEGMSPESAKDTLKKVVSDCDVALKSQWSGAIPRNIRNKIERRKEEALKIIDRLASQFSTGLLGEAVQQPDQQETQQPTQQTTQRAAGRRRRNRSRRQRRRGRGRNRNQSQGSASEVASENLSAADIDDGHDDFDSITILLGKDLLDSQLASFINESEDPCPCCFDRFRVELSDTHAVVNSCGHACCLPCLSDLWKRSTRIRDPIPFTCPICRYPVQENTISLAVEPIVIQTPSLQDRLSLLPLHDVERAEVARSLLLNHNFAMRSVLRSLDAMLTDGLQSSLRRSEDLTPLEKQQIYEEARRPVDALVEEVNQLSARLISIRDFESDEFKRIADRIEEVQSTLIPAARRCAADCIWERINAAGNMGMENEAGEIEVDFHALHVDEAKKQFDERVLPILQAVGSVLLVVGRGNHSEGNVSKLKPALRRHIDNHGRKRCMQHSAVDGNDGVIRVVWRKQN